MFPDADDLDPDTAARARRDGERRRRAADRVAVWVATWLVVQSCAVITLCSVAFSRDGRHLEDLVPTIIFWCLAIAAPAMAALCTFWHWSALSRRCVTVGLTPRALLLTLLTAVIALALFA